MEKNKNFGNKEWEQTQLADGGTLAVGGSSCFRDDRNSAQPIIGQYCDEVITMNNNNGTQTLNPELSQKIRRARRGQGLAEFAVLAPVAIILLAGLVDIGRLFMAQQVMTNAAQEGARLAVSGTYNETEVRNEVRRLLQAEDIGSHESTVTITGIGGASGSPTTVSITHAAPIGMLRLFLDGSTFTLRASSVKVHE